MAAGLNLRLSIKRYNYADDDAVGGAVTTGTVVYTNVFGRLHGSQPDQVLLSQGLETDRMMKFVVQPASLDIRERDLAIVTFPTNFVYYNQDLRIFGVTHSNLTDPRAYIILSVSRSIRAHTIQ